MSNSSKTEYCAECWLLQYKVWAQHDEKYLLSLNYWRSSGIMSYYLLYSGSNYLIILIKYCTPQQNLNFDENQLQYIKFNWINTLQYSKLLKTSQYICYQLFGLYWLVFSTPSCCFSFCIDGSLVVVFPFRGWLVVCLSFSPVLISLSFSIKGALFGPLVFK